MKITINFMIEDKMLHKSGESLEGGVCCDTVVPNQMHHVHQTSLTVSLDLVEQIEKMAMPLLLPIPAVSYHKAPSHLRLHLPLLPLQLRITL